AKTLRTQHRPGQFRRSITRAVFHLESLLITDAVKENDWRKIHLPLLPICLQLLPAILPFQACRSIYPATIACTAIAWNTPIRTVPLTHPAPHSTADGLILVPLRRQLLWPARSCPRRPDLLREAVCPISLRDRRWWQSHQKRYISALKVQILQNSLN